MPTTTNPVSRSETGHAKFIESIERLIAADATLDPAKLNAPADLRSSALAALLPGANTRQTQVGNAKADWRTVTLDRQTDADEIESKAAQAVALLEAQGARGETVEDARSYVRKLQGKRKTPKPADDAATPAVDESEAGISVSQQSNAAKIANFSELIDYLEAQPEYAAVTNPGYTVTELRAFADNLRAKHTVSINAATTLSADRSDRDAFFYTDPNSVLALAKRYKKLVFGAYGANSPEYALVNSIPFQKANK